MIENHMVQPFADDEAEFLPELTDEERRHVLSEIDPDWRNQFFDADAAWGFYYEINQPEMDTLAIEVERDSRRMQARAAVLARLDDTLADIAMAPAQVKRLAS